MREQDIARFWSKVEQSDGCWEWQGCRDSNGYGIFQLDGSARKAHRIAYDLTHTQPLGRLFGCHSCDNPGCVRPDHIFAGTAADNIHDCINKGRFDLTKRKERRKGYKMTPGCHAGERNPRAKLTQQQVEEIRQRHWAGETQTAIARAYSVGRSTIRNIIIGNTWKEQDHA